ncbi:ferredoxin [Roseomonas sp. NAR14]|uniref:Ferredoxin n=1 Tax=Roseomonas acroporae TaxID=2937791 RepID=A0A9X1Y4M0_9PROT|nr:ferredoxin [Roseomonas acroporae]MCK8783318.1 ferredoxin [Roseomonas acroporae]
MYVILTSKPGRFRTELVPGLRPVEAYEYRFHDTVRARFVVAELLHELRLRVIDEAEPPVLNEVPVKFLEKFESVEAARRELAHLTAFGGMKVALERVPAPDEVPEPVSAAA